MTSIVIVDRIDCQPGRPLWQRVPLRDEQGRSLFDFMMLIPRLGSWPDERRQRVYTELETVFGIFHDSVLFADLNLKLNLLWISMRKCPSGCLGLAAAIRERIPEAVLVASQAEVLVGRADASRRGGGGWRGRLFALIPPISPGQR